MDIMPIHRTIITMLSVVMLSSCTSIGTGLANLPAKLGDTQVHKNISYSDNPSLNLDIYTPDQLNDTALPVIVFFHGGRWTTGSKDMYAFVAEEFVKRGYLAVLADYRKYPDVKFPAFVDDAAKAVAWTHDHIQEYGGDKNRLYVSGHSSGAHLGALITADERYLQAIGKKTNIITAFAGLAGPYDFVPDEPDLKDMFGPEENYPQMQVTTFIDGNEPPMMLLWGEQDTAVWRRNLDLLAKKIHQKNGQVTTKIYPDVNHVSIIGGFSWLMSNDENIAEDIDNFFKRYPAENTAHNP